MKKSEVKWRVVQWRRVNQGVPWRVLTGGEVKWSEVKVISNFVCNTCGVKISETTCSIFFPCDAFLNCIATNCSWSFVYLVIIPGCIFVPSCVLFYYVCTVLTHFRCRITALKSAVTFYSTRAIFLFRFAYRLTCCYLNYCWYNISKTDGSLLAANSA